MGGGDACVCVYVCLCCIRIYEREDLALAF